MRKEAQVEKRQRIATDMLGVNQVKVLANSKRKHGCKADRIQFRAAENTRQPNAINHALSADGKKIYVKNKIM
ncbi:hypothetical protein C0J52_13601 [Blattella germanica]|nr:hypothetical protein C0J52_13601 [Blattella germanica]